MFALKTHRHEENIRLLTQVRRKISRLHKTSDGNIFAHQIVAPRIVFARSEDDQAPAHRPQRTREIPQCLPITAKKNVSRVRNCKATSAWFRSASRRREEIGPARRIKGRSPRSEAFAVFRLHEWADTKPACSRSISPGKMLISLPSYNALVD